MMSSRPMPAPASPIVSSRPYGPPDTEKKMIPQIAASPSERAMDRSSMIAEPGALGRLAPVATVSDIKSPLMVQP